MKGAMMMAMRQEKKITWSKFLKILWTFLVVLGISNPSLLSIPVKSRGHSGFITDSTSYQSEVQCLTNAMYLEARSEPEEGIRAVMSVIYNRKNHKNYPNTFCSVILQSKQFSAFNSDSSLAKKPLKPLGAKDKEIHSKVQGIAHEAVQGRFKPVLEPSVLWYAHFKVKNKWTSKYKKVVVYNKHAFYKES